MTKEEDLVVPIVKHLCSRLRRRSKILVHEQVMRRVAWERPDLIIVYSQNPPEWSEYVVEVVELENTLHKAICDENHGVYQLETYPGNRRYLGIPYSVYRRQAQDAIDKKCTERGYGLLAVHEDGTVETKCDPIFKECDLNKYPSALRRWNELVCRKRIKFRWIRNQRMKYSWRESEWKEKLRSLS